MNEKEPIKVKLSTVLLIIAVIVIVAMGVIIGILYKQNTNKSNNELNVENVTTTTTITSNTTTDSNQNNNKTNNTINYTEITKELDEDEVLYITEVENNNGKYILRGLIGKEYFSENEMKEIINKGKVKVDDEVLKIETIKLEKDEEEYKLPYILKNSQGATCEFHKDGSQYHISKLSETSTAWKNANQYRTITLDSDCAVIIEGHNEDIETSLKKECKDFKQKDIDDVGEIFAWSNNLYKFEFKNGKCIKAIRVLTAGL